jgi:hypothetical protein
MRGDPTGLDPRPPRLHPLASHAAPSPRLFDKPSGPDVYLQPVTASASRRRPEPPWAARSSCGTARPALLVDRRGDSVYSTHRWTPSPILVLIGVHNQTLSPVSKGVHFFATGLLPISLRQGNRCVRSSWARASAVLQKRTHPSAELPPAIGSLNLFER